MPTNIEARVEDLEERLSELEGAFIQMQRPRPGIGVTAEEAKVLLRQPVNRGPREYELLQRIFARFDGPEDLSENMRDYLYGERE